MPSRRDFLRTTPLCALAPAVPAFVARSARAAAPDPDGRVLVVVEMSGGNDALNTVVPHADDAYARLRPRLRIDPRGVVRLTDAVGLHPALRPLDRLHQAGRLAILPGVGYPNPSRSHFQGMAVWHTARPDAEERSGHGWLGRALDPGGGTLISVGGDVPAALRGRRSTAVGFGSIDEVLLSDPAAERAGGGPAGGDELLAFVRRQATDARTAAARLAALAGDRGGPTYPQSGLAERLQLVARLLKAGVGSRVFYARQDGYDTHAQQPAAHAALLAEFAGAVAAFAADLGESNLADRVTLLSFSEFGRTVRENGTAGTDHGTAGACFVAGPTVRPGLVGSMPSLTELEAGEPRATTDFRAVYAALLRDWMGLPTEAAGDAPGRCPLFVR